MSMIVCGSSSSSSSDSSPLSENSGLLIMENFERV